MDNLGEILRSSEAVRAAVSVAKNHNQKAYLVGGTVRDLLMNSMPGSDFDFVVEGRGSVFARGFADRVNGSFFILDEERDVSRVVSKKGFQADFSGIRSDIERDLRLRDFTINSMAIPLDSLCSENTVLLDPLRGLNDLNDRVLRATSPDSLKEDPLRILRAFRFSTSFRFKLDTELLSYIREAGEALNRVSAERIRNELFMILDMPGAFHTLQGMDEVGVLKTLFPEVEKWKGFYQGGRHTHDLFIHSMKTVEALEKVLSILNRYFPKHVNEVEEWIGEEVEPLVTRRGLLKLASLMHDSGKFYTRTMEGERGRFLGHENAGKLITAEIARRLKLSRRSEAILRGLTANHMRALSLLKLKRVTNRARYRFFRDTNGFGIDLIILSLADAKATPMEWDRLEELIVLTQELADYYFEEFITIPPAPLLTGENIMKAFGLPQGKGIGEMLKTLQEAEMMGKVSNKGEALEYLRKVWTLKSAM